MSLVWKTVAWAAMMPIWGAVLLVAGAVYLALCAADLYRWAELHSLFHGDRDAQERAWSR